MSRENMKSCCTACGVDWVKHAGIQPTCDRLQHALTACKERDKHIIELCKKSGDLQKRIAELEREVNDCRQIITTYAEETEVQQKRIAELDDLLRSACCIAMRQGVETHWGRFIASVEKLGLNGITARTYRILPSDLEEGGAK